MTGHTSDTYHYIRLRGYSTSALHGTFLKNILSLCPFWRRAKWGFRDSHLPRVSCYKVLWYILNLKSNSVNTNFPVLPFHPDVDVFSSPSKMSSFFPSYSVPAFLLGNQKRGTLLSPSGSSRIFSLTFWNLLDEKCSIVPGLWRLWGWTQPKFEYGALLNDCHSWERGRICRIQDLCTRGPKEREPRHQQLTFIESLFHARGCAMYFLYIIIFSEPHLR